ncbi:DUF5684 domain-containing protein [Leucobacter chromiireducens]|uniref:FHA domain-containing protein n=1 Tax=Leucobacter chromiireducens subsp. chromiireducens TaxID=660067 RepID=A0ABS1SQ16_9MICO|nr:DUF5684 domain-containing protein [Leucobacter chromiireducens]MBL3690173.1 FHA domain-containing protein [Leucobacter chromiireducens subsp. chromiireducens]
MSSELSSGGFTVLVAMLSIWGLVALVLYVWYLWALSKLFPYLGLPSRDGWIPVWNQWQLLKRGGLPGWLVLLGFVPGLILVVIVVSIIAIHRLNREFGKDAWYTVLGAFLPPIWAMLLASHIGDGMYAGARVYQGETAFPPLSPSRRAAAVAAGGGAGSPAASEPAAWRGLPPVSEAALAEAHREPSDPQRAGGAEPVAPVAPVTSPSTGASGSERVRAAADPHDMNDWGFSNTTIGNFERLAAEEVEERPATPLGVRAAPEPFAWPEPRAPRAAAPAPPADLSTPAEPVVPAAPAVTAVPPTPVVPAAPEPPVVPVPPVVPELPVEEQPEPAAAPAAQRWGLELPDGEVLELVGTDIVAGRKPSSLEGSETLLLADPTRTVSKSHVRLRLAGGEWTVEDLNSTNGLTLVSSSGQRAQLPAGLTFPATEHMIFGTLEVHLRAL